MKNFLWHHQQFCISMIVLVSLLLLLAACGTGSQSSTAGSTQQSRATPTSPAVTVTPTSGQSDLTPSPASGVVLGPQACPAGTADLARWETIIGTKGGPQQVQSVSCANITGTPSLQALVTDRRANASDTLDVYVFNNITSTSPTIILQLMGLVKGDAKISGYNTVMTAQADELSTINAGKPISAMTSDLFREFKWSADKGTLVQTAFPGIFPDLTRYQAEADQAQVNQGHQPWKLSATLVANALAVRLLNWSPSSPTTLLSGGGPQDVAAVVRVQSSAAVVAGGGAIMVTLSRLEGKSSGHIWEAVAVATSGLSITSPAPLAQLTSPVQVKGTGPAFEGQVGQVIVLDHLYHALGQANAIGAIGEGQTSFSSMVSFQSTFPAGIQEGVLFLSALSNANGSIAAAVMEKVLVNGGAWSGCWYRSSQSP